MLQCFLFCDAFHVMRNLPPAYHRMALDGGFEVNESRMGVFKINKTTAVGSSWATPDGLSKHVPHVSNTGREGGRSRMIKIGLDVCLFP